MYFAHLAPVSVASPGLPLGLENLGKWEDIFKLRNRFEKSGEIAQNTGKVGELLGDM